MQHDLAARLRAALHPWNEVALAGVLSPGVRMIVDSGDETGGEQCGRSRVLRGIRERLAMHPDASIHEVHVNGRPGLALRRGDDGRGNGGNGGDGEVIGVLVIDGDDAIDTLWISTAPLKLAAWNRRRPEAD